MFGVKLGLRQTIILIDLIEEEIVEVGKLMGKSMGSVAVDYHKKLIELRTLSDLLNKHRKSLL